MATKNVIKKIIKDWVEYFIYSTKWEIEVDSTLSDTSENPVQNKVVKAAIDWKITNPSGWTTGQVLTKTQNWEAWQDAQGWLPEWWTEWQFIRKTASWSEWVDGELVEITEWDDDYSAMQWPCLNGYHIPMSSEFEWINDIISNFGLSYSDLKSKLHSPSPWYRADTDGVVYWSWNNGYFWCSNCNEWTDKVYTAYIWWSTFSISGNVGRSYWRNIRPFYNRFVVPDNTRTVEFWTLGSAGIFHNATLWLISITSDWTTWYTISDKNLWATQVWNSWDTLSEANCGKFYQRWNNYGFAWTWSVTTSSTKVDASAYWPWNYYSSSTFIIGGYTDWSSVQNDNLRWWETWVTKKDRFLVDNKELAWKEYVDDIVWDVETLLANI